MFRVRKKNVDEQTSTAPDKRPVQKSRAQNKAAAEFLRLLKAGDEVAWKQLTDEWGPKLYRYLRCNLPSNEDVEDVLSETMIATVQAIPRFDGKVALSTFIYSIANRKVADFWRQRKDTSELPISLTTAGPNSESIEFNEALNKLPEQSREALLLRYHVGMGVNEVAETLGRSYKATESLLSRARRQLQDALQSANIK